MAASKQIAPIHVIKRVWERIAPLQLAEKSWDNVGRDSHGRVEGHLLPDIMLIPVLIIEAPEPDLVKKQVLLTVDLTTAVCAEALALPSCSVVISYHPPIFRALKSITMSDPLQASLLRLSARGISIFSPHTSLDATPKGINTWLIKPFESNTASAKAISHSTAIEGFEHAGIGKIVQFKEGMKVSKIVELVKEHLSLKYVQLATPHEESEINSIAVCAGSGASVFKGVEADLLFTGEMSHHEVLSAVASGQSVILTNHTNTERPYLSQVLRPWLEKELNSESDEGESGWEGVVSKEDADPLRTV